MDDFKYTEYLLEVLIRKEAGETFGGIVIVKNYHTYKLGDLTYFSVIFHHHNKYFKFIYYVDIYGNAMIAETPVEVERHTVETVSYRIKEKENEA